MDYKQSEVNTAFARDTVSAQPTTCAGNKAASFLLTLASNDPSIDGLVQHNLTDRRVTTERCLDEAIEFAAKIVECPPFARACTVHRKDLSHKLLRNRLA